jgi:predicted nucleic acid-binding protein
VICLDTNYLILGLVAGSPEERQLRDWLAEGTRLVTPTVVWFEFLCGPVSTQQIEAMRACLHAIIPLSEAHTQLAAELFNAAGRRPDGIEGSRVDAMIAASAILADAPLATQNTADFEDFQAAGLAFVA